MAANMLDLDAQPYQNNEAIGEVQEVDTAKVVEHVSVNF